MFYFHVVSLCPNIQLISDHHCCQLQLQVQHEAMAMREIAGAMKEMAREIADAGGLADRNLRDFVKIKHSKLMHESSCASNGT